MKQKTKNNNQRNSPNKVMTILRLPVDTALFTKQNNWGLRLDAALFTEQNNRIETRCCIVHKTK